MSSPRQIQSTRDLRSFSNAVLNKLFEKEATSDQTNRMLQDMVTAGGVAFPTVLLARMAMAHASFRKGNDIHKIESYTNAKYPVIDLDPTKNLAKEDEERKQGLVTTPEPMELTAFEKLAVEMVEKEADGEILDKVKQVKDTLLGILSGAATLTGKLAGTGLNLAGKAVSSAEQFGKDRSPFYLAGVTGAGMAGGIGGYAVADWLRGKQEENVQDKQIAESRDNLDKLLYQQYRQSRGIDKTSSDGNGDAIANTAIEFSL